MDELENVYESLGGSEVVPASSPRTEMDFVAIIRNGLPVRSRELLIERLGATDGKRRQLLESFVGPPLPRQQAGDRLKAAESELLLRLARVIAAASDVLGSEQRASEWIFNENQALGGAPPIRLLDTGIGFQEVMAVLHRIEHGVFS